MNKRDSTYRTNEPNTEGMTCWECGHWLIGGGCWKYGQMHEDGWKNTGPNDSCEEWVEEGTEGTITYLIHEDAKNMEPTHD